MAHTKELKCSSMLSVLDRPYRFTLDGFEEVFIKAQGKQAQILRMNLEEYRAAVQADSIPVNSILVLDEIDLELDLPIVAGVIISQPFSLQDTHSQDISEKMGIPIVYMPGAYQHQKLRELSEEENSQVNLSTLEDIPVISVGFPEPQVDRIQPILPVAVDAAEEPLIVRSDSREEWPREIVGDKFFPLAKLAREGYSEIPKMAVLTTHFFTSFLEYFEFEGRTLKDFIDEKTLKLAPETDSLKIKKILAEIRNAILNSIPKKDRSENFLERVFNRLKKMIPMFPGASLSLRSDNDIEDLIASGAHASVRTQDSSLEEFEQGIKKVISSLYSSRAHNIREAWNIGTENLRMPILVHSYIDNEDYNGTAKFYTNEKGQLVTSVRLVKGSDSKATNPSLEAEIIEQDFIYEEPSFVPLGEDLLETKFAFAMESFLNSLEPFVREHIYEMKISPLKIQIEFVATYGVFRKLDKPVEGYKFNLLQYKHRYDNNVVYGVLKGDIPRQDLDVSFESAGKNENLDKIASSLDASLLDTLREGFEQIRFALLKVGEKYEIVTWNNYNFHQAVKIKIEQNYPDIKWVRSGYILLENDGSIVFSKTKSELVDNENVFESVQEAEEAFREAIKRAYQRQHRFFQFMNLGKYKGLKILFSDFFEGKQWTLSVDEIKSWMVSDVQE